MDLAEAHCQSSVAVRDELIGQSILEELAVCVPASVMQLKTSSGWRAGVAPTGSCLVISHGKVGPHTLICSQAHLWLNPAKGNTARHTHTMT